MKKLKTIVVIPARGGSKRLPNKNILPLADIPLLGHSIIYAKENLDYIDDIYVSTDSLKIKKIALSYGVKVIDRPEHISGDLEPTISVLKHVVHMLEEVETVILLQPTNPLRPKSLLKDCFLLYKKQNYDSVFTVSRDEHKLGRIADGKFLPFNYKVGQRSQDLEPLYFENGLLYIAKVEAILNNEIITSNGFPYLVDHKFANIDIDTQSDFEYAEYVLSKSIK